MGQCTRSCWSAKHRAVGRGRRLSSTDGWPRCGSGRGRHGAFADQLPLELGQRCEDAEHEAAGRGRGVDLRALAGEHPQAHAAGGQVLHGVDQMGEVARPR